MLVRFFVTLSLLASVLLILVKSSPEGDAFLLKNSKRGGVKETNSGLQYRVIKSGKSSGISPNASSTCHVHYRGTLAVSGIEFDSSRKRGSAPAKFRPSDVIGGWKEALRMMKEGDKFELAVPPHLAYGKRKVGKHITPDSVLIFEIELVKVDPDSDSANFFFFIPSWLRNVPSMVWIVAVYFIYNIVRGAGSPATKLKKVPLKEAMGNIGNKRVFMDIAISGVPSMEPYTERLEIELFSSLVPKTSTNFLYLCTGERGKGRSGKNLHYLNTFFHRVIPKFMAQGGDFERGNGTGGESVYGGKFQDEFQLGYVSHDEPYLLSMANAGPNTNGSQFFITFRDTLHLDGKHVVFGKVVSGVHLVKAMEKYGTPSGKPTAVIQVKDCGEVKLKDSKGKGDEGHTKRD